MATCPKCKAGIPFLKLAATAPQYQVKCMQCSAIIKANIQSDPLRFLFHGYIIAFGAAILFAGYQLTKLEGSDINLWSLVCFSGLPIGFFLAVLIVSFMEFIEI